MKNILVRRKFLETTAAVLVNEKLDALYSSNDDNPRLSGNIYKGRVQNILPGMKIAFIDNGCEKIFFLWYNAARKVS